MKRISTIATTVMALAILTLSAGGASANCITVEFKDTEYGFNYDNNPVGWSIWRKPITEARAEALKRSSVAYLEVPKDFQKANRPVNPAHGLAAAGAMHSQVSERKHSGVKAWTYSLQMRSRAPSDRGKMYVIHDIHLIVSPASKRSRKLVQHEWITLLTEPRVEIVPERTPSQSWDVYLVITKHGTLGGPGWGKPDREEWHRRWKASGVNDNFQDGWKVRMCK